MTTARDSLRVAVALAVGNACFVAPGIAAAQGDDWYFTEPPPGSRPPPSPPEPPAPTATEVRPPRFGAPGEVAISGTSGIGASYTTYDGSQASSLSASFGPAFDVFVARNVSLGLSAGVSYGDSRGYGADGSLVDTTATSLSGAVRVGANVPISSLLSFWPRLLLGFEWVHQSVQTVSGATDSTTASALGYPTTTRSGPWGEVVLPLTLHVAPHLFASFGPSVFHEFSDAQGGPDVGGERTTVGAYLDVGGWFGGRRDTAGDAAGEEPPVIPLRRFGSARDLVITNAFVLQGFWTSYAGSGSTATSVTLTPGLDYFVADHVSLGISLGGSYNGSSGIDATTGNSVTFSHHSFSVAPRFGVDIPMGAYVSFWPVASLGIGGGSYAESEGTKSDDYSDSFISVSLYAPLLVHPASHFFVGLGPSVSHDLTNSISYPDSSATPQNRSTTVGAGLLVGGVL
jgi:hypothetical protein